MLERGLLQWCKNWGLAAVLLCLQAALAAPLPAPAVAPAAQDVLWVDAAAERQTLQTGVQWCLDPTEKLDVQAVSHGACPLRPAQKGDLTQGLKAGAMWLRLQLGNAGAEQLTRWLVVGHPRLQQVTLWVPISADNANSGWQALHSGISTPLRERALAASYPVLPVTLAPASVQTVYLRVASQTTLEASVALWRPTAYEAQQGHLDVLHAVALGCLLLAAVFGAVLFGLLRERIYALFALAMLGELALEAHMSGLMALHFWPTNWPFPVGLLAVNAGVAATFLILFMLEFVGAPTRHGWLVTLIKVLLGVYALGALWGLLAQFRQGMGLMTVTLQGIIPVLLALLVLRYRQGQNYAGYLLLLLLPVIFNEALRLAITLGWLPSQAEYIVAVPWTLMLMAPFLLLGLVRRSRDLYSKLVHTQAESQARVHFLAQMSHELRSPLATVQAYAQVLQRPQPSVSASEAASAIERSGQRVLDMLDEILDYARGQAERLLLDPAPVHWPTLVQDLQQHGNALAHQHGNQFVLLQPAPSSPDALALPPGADLLLDERRLRQVLDNLISNANRYTLGGTVTLSCQALALPNQTARLSFEVADTGLGIAPEEQSIIFDPFVRGAAALQGKIKGVGLGLAVARQLTRLMGGTLTLKSQLGVGTTFTVQLTCLVDA